MRKQDSGIDDLRVNNKIITEDKDKAEALSKQFASVFTDEDKTSIPSLGESRVPDIPQLIIYPDGVLELLKNLKDNKAPGPDGIPPWILKMTAEEISPILANIFQVSIDKGYLPSQWREANICPIFKKGDKAEPANYRGVSLTSVTSKILEHIVHSHVMDHLEANKILVDNQHGFRAKHSTVSQLVLTMHDLTGRIEKGETIHMAILDFAKAFDKVPHERLLGN